MTYVWLTQALIMPIYFWTWWEIAVTIRSGDVVADLSKPIDYYGLWLARDAGRAVYHCLFRFAPTLLVGVVLFGVPLPMDPGRWLVFGVSLALAVWISFGLRFLYNLAAFWLLDYRGVGGLIATTVTFLSGFLVPLNYFPPEARAVIAWLPFAGMVQAPVEVFLGHRHGADLAAALLFQAAWAVAFVVAGRLALAAASRKVVFRVAEQQAPRPWRQDAALYRRLLGALVRAQMQYRASFALMTLTTLVATGSELLAILILFAQFGSLAGWTAGEVALLYGLTSVAFGVHEMVVAGFDVFPTAIRRGEFDRVLVRPVSVFVQVLSADFQLRRIGRISQGLLALGLALAWTSPVWTPVKVVYLPVALLSGAVIYGALTVLGAVLCFWTVQSIEIINVLTYGGSELSSYPFEIYPVGIQRFFTLVIPLAFVSYYPGLYLLDRADPLGLPAWLSFVSPVAAVSLAAAAWLAWQVGVRHYQSTGT